jgi:hypothetical protein
MVTMLERSVDVSNPVYRTWQTTFRISRFALTVYVGRSPARSVVGVAHRMTMTSICLSLRLTTTLPRKYWR